MKKLTWLLLTMIFIMVLSSTTFAKTLTISNDYANLRSAPGANNEYLGKVIYGDTLDILGEGKAPNGKLWYKTEKGWVCSSFVKIETNDILKNSRKFNLTEYEKRYIASVVSAEARGEGFTGQKAVTQVIFDRADCWNKKPIDICKAKGQFAKPWGGSNLRYTNSCYRAVCAIFDDGERVVDSRLFYFYDRYMLKKAPGYLSSKTYVTTIGCHKFYK